ncbi:MAG: hypothetical protein AAB567_02620 [Patescibacteria group bacterium]
MKSKTLKTLTFFWSLVFASLIVSQVFAQTDSQGGFIVEQKVRNLTQKKFSWLDSVEAARNDRIEFQITITWRGFQTTKSVLLSEVLGDMLAYEGNLKLDGAPVAGNLSKEQLSLGDGEPNKPKMVTFEATVAVPESFTESRDLVNTSTAFNAEGSASSKAIVRVGKNTSPTEVSTGAFSIWMAAFLATLGLVFLGSYLFLIKYYVSKEILRSSYETRAERKLASMIERIKAKKRKGGE